MYSGLGRTIERLYFHPKIFDMFQSYRRKPDCLGRNLEYTGVSVLIPEGGAVEAAIVSKDLTHSLVSQYGGENETESALVLVSWSSLEVPLIWKEVSERTHLIFQTHPLKQKFHDQRSPGNTFTKGVIINPVNVLKFDVMRMRHRRSPTSAAWVPSQQREDPLLAVSHAEMDLLLPAPRLESLRQEDAAPTGYRRDKADTPNKRIRQEPNQNTERGKPKTTNTETQKHTEKQNNTLYQPKTANRILLQMRAILGNLFGVGDSSKWLWVASIKRRKL